MALHRHGLVYKPRGFFCDDKLLMYPFHESTVSNTLMKEISYFLSLIIIIIVEALRTTPKCVKTIFKHIYAYLRIYVFGLACNSIITDSAKFIVGRLRPYFFAVCKPLILPNRTTCRDPENSNRFIEEYECTTIDSLSNDDRQELFTSFPSGHASISFYVLIFTAIYLQYRMNWDGSKLLKHFIQFLLIMAAWVISLTRIFDYRHHCE